MKTFSSAWKRQLLFRGTMCVVLVYTFALASYTVRTQLGPHVPLLRVLLWGVIGTAASVALFISRSPGSETCAPLSPQINALLGGVPCNE